MSSASDIVMSSDGEHLYVSAGITNGSNAIAVIDRDTVTGEISQPAGLAGCISDNGFDRPLPFGVPGACTDSGLPLNEPVSIAISPDDDHLYAAVTASDAVAIFTIQPAGTLSEAGCISQGGAGPCTKGRALDRVRSIAASPDGEQIYAGSINPGSEAVAALDRNPATGALSQAASAAGCVANLPGPEGCADGHGLRALGLTLSADGRNLYAGNSSQGGVVSLDRETNGDISQTSGFDGCWAEDPFLLAPCQDGRGLKGADALAIGPSGRFAYVASETSDAIAVFERELPPSCAIPPPTPDLAHAGSAEISLACSDVNGDALTRTVVTPPAKGTLGTIDNGAGTVTYTATPGQSGADSFTFDADDGGQSSPTRTVNLTIAVAPAGPPPPGPDLDPGSTPNPTPDPDPPIEPVFEERAISGDETKGKVKIKRPGNQDFKPLKPGETVPVGSVVDTSAEGAQVEVITATNNGGTQFRSIIFSEGVFRLAQAPSGITRAFVVASEPCGSTDTLAGSAPDALTRAKGKKKPGKGGIFANGGGGHQTTGKNGSATVQGTIWRTEDLCNGSTRFTLLEGKLKIRDFSKGKTVILKPEASGEPGVYTARPK